MFHNFTWQILFCTTVVFLVVGFVWLFLPAQPNRNSRPWVNDITEQDSPILDQLLDRNDPVMKLVLANPDLFRLQIIFSQVNRNQKNQPFIKHHTWRLDTLEYFYPASMVKLPTAALSLEKIRQLKIPDLDPYTKMQVSGSTSPCHRPTAGNEASNTWGHACLVQYLKHALVSSDNISYDRLYEFVGQQELNETLHERGYRSANITQRYGAYCSLSENKYTQRVRFHDKEDQLIYDQPARQSPRNFEQKMRTRIGRAKKLDDGSLVDEPYDFTGRNFMNLKDLHEVLMSIMMPMAMARDQVFHLEKEDYKVLHKYMSMYPTESTDPWIDRSYYTTTRMKYLLYGNVAAPDPNVRIFNKVGFAHGFLIDCAYIVDFDKKVEFFVSALIFTNRKGVTGDGNYEYFSIGMPFLKRLGEILLQNERKRLRKYDPDLEFYIHDYSSY